MTLSDLILPLQIVYVHVPDHEIKYRNI